MRYATEFQLEVVCPLDEDLPGSECTLFITVEEGLDVKGGWQVLDKPTRCEDAGVTYSPAELAELDRRIEKAYERDCERRQG